MHSHYRSNANDDSLAQQVEHNTFNVGVLGSSPSGFTEEENVVLLFFVFGALAFGYLLAETPNRPAGDNGGSSVKIGLRPTFEPRRVHQKTASFLAKGGCLADCRKGKVNLTVTVIQRLSLRIRLFAKRIHKEALRNS